MKYIFIIFIFCFSCGDNSSIHLKTDSISYTKGKLLSLNYEYDSFGYPFPQLSFENEKTYIHSIRINNPSILDKYYVQEDELVLVDSIFIPNHCFGGVKNHIQDMEVVNDSLFIFQPSSFSRHGGNKFYHITNNELDSFMFQKEMNDKEVYLMSTKLNFMNLNSEFGVGEVKMETVSFDGNEVCKYPALALFYWNKENEIVLFEEQHPDRCNNKLKEPLYQMYKRTVKGDSIITLYPYDQEFHIFNRKGEKVVKYFEFPEFDEFQEDKSNKVKQFVESDSFISFEFSKFNNKFYLVMFEANNYIEPTEFIAQPKQKREFVVLIFDEKLNLESQLNLSKRDMNIHNSTIIPSPKGFYLSVSTSEQKYILQEFILQEFD